MTPSFAESYRKGTKTITEFTGSIFTFPFNPSSNLFAKSSINTCIQNIDEIVDCSFINVNNGNVTGGGTGGSRTIGDISDPQAGNTFEGITTGGGGTAVWVCSPCGVSHSNQSECTCGGRGGGIGEGTWIITLFPATHTYKMGVTKTETNCCDGADVTGPVGVNLLTSVVNYITKCVPNLSQQQIDFLNGSLQSFAIKNYLEENKNPNGSCNQAASDFAKEAVEVLKNGGEVDFKNEILKDPSFIGTKADCVLDILLGQTGYFKEVMDAISNDNSEYKIKFTVGELSAQNTGGDG